MDLFGTMARLIVTWRWLKCGCDGGVDDDSDGGSGWVVVLELMVMIVVVVMIVLMVMIAVVVVVANDSNLVVIVVEDAVRLPRLEPQSLIIKIVIDVKNNQIDDLIPKSLLLKLQAGRSTQA